MEMVFDSQNYMDRWYEHIVLEIVLLYLRLDWGVSGQEKEAILSWKDMRGSSKRFRRNITL